MLGRDHAGKSRDHAGERRTILERAKTMLERGETMLERGEIMLERGKTILGTDHAGERACWRKTVLERDHALIGHLVTQKQ